MNSPSMTVMMVAGERSGDMYGAQLAAALRARLEALKLFGCGGQAMRQAGVEAVVDAEEFAMLGIVEVVSGLWRAYRSFHRLLDAVDRRRPRLAVLIDSPSLNIRLAKRLRRRGVTVVYFISPQIWAWKQWRIHQLRARVDKMLCIFDFEEEIYRRAGIPVEYVGHPLVGMVFPHLSREQFFASAGLDPSLSTVALLPGSRPKEVAFNFPTILDAAACLARERRIQFVVAAAPSLDTRWLETNFLEGRASGAALRLVSHATYDALAYSDVAIVASGTATVEAALLGRPMVVVYRVARSTWFFGKLMVDVPFYSMVNLMAKKQVVPELIQGDFTPQRLVAEVEYLLDHPQARQEMAAEFRALRRRLGAGGAIEKAAETVAGMSHLSAALPLDQ